MIIKYDQETMQALIKLGNDFPSLNWNFSQLEEYQNNENTSHWPGEKDENVMICIFKGNNINEQFHRQDFFFLHFAYDGNYEALSSQHNNRIVMNEGDCYIGQPFHGYGAKKDGKEECIIIGVLIKKKIFVQEFLASFSTDTALLNFFLEPHKNIYADEFVHLNLADNPYIWRLLGLMILEYAYKTEDTQKIIKPLIMSLCLYISVAYKKQNLPAKQTLTDQIIEYIESHIDHVTLTSLAQHFGYHPVYISRLLSQKTKKTYSQIINDTKMQRAQLLLNHTDMSVEKIAIMLGYSNTSNFYKAFKFYFGTTPRKL